MNTVEQQFKKAVHFLEANNKISSKKDLAKSIDVSPQALSEILSDRNKIRTSTLQLFCKNYQINLNWLFYGEGSMFDESETNFLASENTEDDDNALPTKRDVKEIVQKEVKEALQREREAQNKLAS